MRTGGLDLRLEDIKLLSLEVDDPGKNGVRSFGPKSPGLIGRGNRSSLGNQSVQRLIGVCPSNTQLLGHRVPAGRPQIQQCTVREIFCWCEAKRSEIDIYHEK